MVNEEKQYWESTEQLLDEVNRIVFIEVDYKGKKIKLAWKEIMEGVELDIDPSLKPMGEMTPAEQLDFNVKILTAEAIARIKSAGVQEGCLNKNVVTREIWNKFPQRIQGMIINEMFQLIQVREKLFQ